MPNAFLSTVGSTVGSTARKGYRAIIPIAIRRRVRARLTPPAKPRSPAPRPPATRRFELYLPRAEGTPGGSANGRSSLVIEAPGRLFVAKLPNGPIRELRIGTDDRTLGFLLKGFGQDGDGELYACGSLKPGPKGPGGIVVKIVPAAAPK